jgi:hypothetical protein
MWCYCNVLVFLLFFFFFFALTLLALFCMAGWLGVGILRHLSLLFSSLPFLSLSHVRVYDRDDWRGGLQSRVCLDVCEYRYH